MICPLCGAQEEYDAEEELENQIMNTYICTDCLVHKCILITTDTFPKSCPMSPTDTGHWREVE